MWKRKRGNGFIICLVMVGFSGLLIAQLGAARSLGYTNRADAQHYADLQTEYSIADMAVVQFVRDLQSIALTKDAGTEWVTVSKSAEYNYALSLIQQQVVDSDGHWTCNSIGDLTSALGITELDALNILQDAAEDGLTVSLLEDMGFDWLNKGTKVGRKESSIVVQPVPIEVQVFNGKSSIEQRYLVSGLVLDVETESETGSTIVRVGGTMCLERE